MVPHPIHPKRHLNQFKSEAILPLQPMWSYAEIICAFAVLFIFFSVLCFSWNCFWAGLLFLQISSWNRLKESGNARTRTWLSYPRLWKSLKIILYHSRSTIFTEYGQLSPLLLIQSLLSLSIRILIFEVLIISCICILFLWWKCYSVCYVWSPVTRKGASGGCLNVMFNLCNNEFHPSCLWALWNWFHHLVARSE